MQTWLELLATAIHCPSPHNVQPWRVKLLDDKTAELYIDVGRTLPKEDVTGSFIILTMGMFLESISILAENKSHRLRFELFHEPGWYSEAILNPGSSRVLPFARMTLEACETGPSDLDTDLFLKRRTSRIRFEAKPIEAEILNDLKTIAKEWNQRFEVVVDERQIARIMELNTRALFEDLNSREYHDEIVEWFRYTEKHSLKHLDGLDARCMNTSPLNYWLIARFPRLLLIPGGKQVMAKIYRSQLGPIATLGVIAGKFWDPADAIDSGRFLIRFWLRTAAAGQYIHPYGNLVTNRAAAAQVREDLGVDNIWLMFKLGRSDIPPKSHRLPVEGILL